MDRRLDVAWAMMENPDKRPAVEDFFDEPINFSVDPWDNDELVKLYRYKKEWFWYNITQGVILGEHIPCAGYVKQIMSEVGVADNEEFFDKLIFAGECVAEERRWQEMSEEERADIKALRKNIHQDFNDPTSMLHEGVQYAIDKVTSQNEEIEELNKLLEE